MSTQGEARPLGPVEVVSLATPGLSIGPVELAQAAPANPPGQSPGQPPPDAQPATPVQGTPLAAPGDAPVDGAVGRIDSVEGEVFVVRADGTREAVEPGASIFPGDVVETEAGGNVGLVLADNTSFSLGEGGRMALTEVSFNAAAGTGGVKVNVQSGQFAFTSGESALAGGLEVTTPVGVIGVQGAPASLAGIAAPSGQQSQFTLLEGPGGTIGPVTLTNNGGQQTLDTVGATTQLASGFERPPPPFIMSPQDIQNLTGGLAIRAIPGRGLGGPQGGPEGGPQGGPEGGTELVEGEGGEFTEGPEGQGEGEAGAGAPVVSATERGLQGNPGEQAGEQDGEGGPRGEGGRFGEQGADFSPNGRPFNPFAAADNPFSFAGPGNTDNAGAFGNPFGGPALGNPFAGRQIGDPFDNPLVNDPFGEIFGGPQAPPPDDNNDNFNLPPPPNVQLPQGQGDTGSEFQVNTATSGNQDISSVAPLSGGGFVVVWVSSGQDGGGLGIYGQRYDDAGNAAGSEFRLNTQTADNQGYPCVEALAGGGFVAAWYSDNQDGSGGGVYAQRYDTSGNTVGSEFRINSETSNHQSHANIGALPDGSFVVTWSSFTQDGGSWGVYGQRYDSSGNTAGSEFRVNSHTAADQTGSHVAAISGGGFVVTWESLDQDGSLRGIYGQRYDSSGNTAGSEFRVNTTSAGSQEYGTTTSLSDGGFFVTWTSGGNQDGSGQGLYGQRFDTSGNTVGGEVRFNTTTSGDQWLGSATELASGEIVAVWSSNGQDGSGQGVYGQRIDAQGTQVGSEFQINTVTSGDQLATFRGPVAALPDGGFVVTWESAGQDGSGKGVFAQRFDAFANKVGSVAFGGTAGDDTFTGGAESELIFGKAGADVLNGGGGDDILRGDAGDDILTGGSGTDLAVFNGNQSSYTMTGAGIGIKVTDNDTGTDGDDGTDTLIGVEWLQFKDGLVAVSGSSSEFQVNTFTTGDQGYPEVATLSNGDFVVTWTSTGQDGSLGGSYGQRYDASGNKLGAEFRLNTHTADNQTNPLVTDLADGGFVAVWQSWNQDGSRYGAYGQRYDLNGNAAGSEFQLNTTTANSQVSPSVAGLSGGGFVATWDADNQDGSGYAIIGRSYNADGTAASNEFQINTASTSDQYYSRVEALSNGGFVATWMSTGQDGGGMGIFGQRFDSAGIKVGTEFRANTTTTGDQTLQSVDAISDGGFVIAWQSAGQDGSGTGVFGQRYNSSGDTAGSEFQINTHSIGDQGNPAISGINGGGFVITWTSANRGDGVDGIYAQRFDAAGAKSGTEFLVNVTTTNVQVKSQLDGLTDGGFVATWQSAGQDGSGNGVFAQRFDANGNAGEITFLGSSGDDTLTSGAIADNLKGGAGNDTLIGNLGNDSLSGGSGTDTASYASAAVAVNINLTTGVGTGEGVDTLTGIENIIGSANADTLVGNSADNVLDGRAGNDTIGGGAGTDTLIGGAGDDTLVGGDGMDTVSFASAGSSITFNLATTTAQNTGEGSDTITTMENVIGSAQDDTLTGDANANVIQGGGGADTLKGEGGADTFNIAAATDLASGEAITGGAGTDILAATGGTITAMDLSNVTLSGVETISLDSGAVTGVTLTIDAADVADVTTIQGDGSGDRLILNDATNLTGKTLTGIETITGSGGVDTIVGGASAETISGGGGADNISGSGGNDVITYGAGDTINGGADTDTLNIGTAGALDLTGNTTITNMEHVDLGVSGTDITLTLGAADAVNFTDSNNVLTILGGSGDTVTSGNGWDLGGTATVGSETYQLYTSGSATLRVDTDITRNLPINGQTISGGSGGDTLAGSAGGDIIGGLGGSDVITGAAGGDTITGGTGNDTIDGGTGTDIAVFSGAMPGYSITRSGTAIQVTDTATSTSGDDGTDTLTGVETLRFTDGDLSVSIGNGTEFQVNTETSGNQDIASVAPLSGGGFVIVWVSNGQDGGGLGIYGQRYDDSGNTAGSEFRINTQTSDNQGYPCIEALTGGGFVVAWYSDNQDGSSGGVYGQRYDGSGNAVGSEFLVNTQTSNAQSNANIGALSNGGFVVTWSSYTQDGSSWGVYGQRYDSSGNTVGSEFRVNSTTASDQTGSHVTALSGGGFVVVWESVDQDGSLRGIYGQRYDSSGNTAGSEFRANTTTAGSQEYGAVISLSDGGFFVTWTSGGNQDGSGQGMYGQRFDGSGDTVGSEVRFNTTTASDQWYGSGTELASGEIVAVWSSNGQDGGGAGVYGQRLDAQGNLMGSEFQVNTVTTGDQLATFRGPVAALPDGGFVVTWESAGQDGSGKGIYAQRFDADGNKAAPVTITGTGNADTLTGGDVADVISGAGGNDVIDGGGGSDSLSGGDGDDTLSGGSGTDQLNGGIGADRLTGGAGNDLFAYAESHIGTNADTITDFTAASTEDRIDYNGTALKNGSTSGAYQFVSATATNTNLTDATAMAINVGGQSADITSQVATVIASMTGFSADAGDVVLLAINKTNGTDSTIWRWADATAAGGDNDGAVDTSEIEALATLSNVTVDQLSSADFV